MIDALETEAKDIYTNSMISDETVLKLRILKLRSILANTQIPTTDQLKLQTYILKSEYAIHERQSPQVIPSTSSKESALDELNMLSSELQVSKSDMYEAQQMETGQDVAAMAQTIKQNALKFQKKLESDAEMVTSTSDSIYNTAGGIATVAQAMNKYRRSTQIGWKFYLLAAVFILFVATIGWSMIIAIPKW